MSKLMSKKAAIGAKGQAAALVGIILLIIVLYIIFLPPEDRADLLGTDEDGGTTSSSREKIVSLLEASPGILTKDVTEQKADKGLPNIFLVETISSQVLERINPFTISNSLLRNTPKEALFSIDDPEHTDNVFLSFSARKHEGTLLITLNGGQVFSSEIEQYNAVPIKLPKTSLKQDNRLVFEVSRGTLGANEYQLENIQIIGDVRDVSRRESQSSFTMLQSELANLESVAFRFVPYCARERDLGKLAIWINDYKIYHSVPVCDDPVRQTFPAQYLAAGSNTVVFESERGSYSIEQIFINLDFKEQRTATYFFELNETTFGQVQNQTRQLFLTLRFVDDKDTDSRFFVNVNGHKRGEFSNDDFEADDITFRYDLGRFAERRNNYVQIIPQETLKIVSLDVTLEKD